MTITDPGLDDLITEIETTEADDPVHDKFSGRDLVLFSVVVAALAAIPFVWAVAA